MSVSYSVMMELMVLPLTSTSWSLLYSAMTASRASWILSRILVGVWGLSFLAKWSRAAA